MSKIQAQTIATSYSTILGQMIRQLRERDSIDQAALAEHMGVSIMTISRIETGDTVLDVPQMEKVAQFFKYDPVAFFKNSLEIKQKIEKEHYAVFQNKKEINSQTNVAMLSVAAIVGVIVGVLLTRK